MTQYAVILTPTAETELLEAFDYIRQDSPLNAARWLQDLYNMIGKLEHFAGHRRVPEADLLECELRQVVFKSHRIIYSVDPRSPTVYVHYVRHCARRWLDASDHP